MTEQELQAYIQAITPADRAAMDAAEKRQAELAKPPGSLGVLLHTHVHYRHLVAEARGQ